MRLAGPATEPDMDPFKVTLKNGMNTRAGTMVQYFKINHGGKLSNKSDFISSQHSMLQIRKGPRVKNLTRSAS